MEFPIRPAPIRGEDIRSYSLRLLLKNGRFSLSELFPILSLTNNISRFSFGSESNEEFFKKLGSMIRRDPKQLNYFFKNQYIQLEINKDRAIRNFGVSNPKLCQSCMIEKGFFPYMWRLMHVTHCAKHKTLLLDCCPHCNEPLVWHGDIFTKCPACKTPWEHQESDEHLPPYMNKLLVGYIKCHEVRIECLASALLLCLRPHDRLFNPIERLNMTNQEIHFYLMQAHALLSHDNYRNWWLSDNSIDFSIVHFEGDSYINSLKTLSNRYNPRLNHQFINKVYYEKKPLDIQLSKPRIQALEKGVPLTRQVDSYGAAQYLNMDNVDINDLVRNETLKSYYGTKIWLAKTLDIEDVHHSINESLSDKAILITKEEIAPLSSIYEVSNYLDRFSMKMADFIQWLLKSDAVQLYKKANSVTWDRLLVKKSDMLRALDMAMLSYLPEHITKTKFCNIFSVAEPQLQQIVEVTELHFESWNKCSKLNKQDVVNFTKKYQIANRWARIHMNVSRRYIENLQKDGFQPTVKLAKKWPVGIFDRTEQLDNYLYSNGE